MFTTFQRVALTLVAAFAVSVSTPVIADASPRTSPEISATSSRSPARPAAGTFEVDVASLNPRPVHGNKCEFTVNGTLYFEGTLSGEATGTTTALIFAPCSEATTFPPGTFFDVFRFEGEFSGTVNRAPVTGDLTYAGVTRKGGAIEASIVLDADGARAVLRAEARVAVGGKYIGVARGT